MPAWSERVRVRKSIQGKKSPDPLQDRGVGWLSLVRGEVLAISQVVDVAEHWRGRRQVLRIGEQRIEHVVTYRRLIHHVLAALECTRVVGRVEEADQRSLVVE